MKRKLVTKLLCLVLASTVVATMAPVNFYTVSAETQDQSEDVAVQAEPRVVLQDGINDQWTQEASSVVGSDAMKLIILQRAGLFFRQRLKQQRQL